MKNTFLFLVLTFTGFAFGDCFHGWISMSSTNGSPTGECTAPNENPETKDLWTNIEIDFPTQVLYIHGGRPEHSDKSHWFRFEATSCKDIEDGWTVVEGINRSTGEKYLLRHREIHEVPATGQLKQLFEGEAELSVELEGKSYQSHLGCWRGVY